MPKPETYRAEGRDVVRDHPEGGEPVVVFEAMSDEGAEIVARAFNLEALGVPLPSAVAALG